MKNFSLRIRLILSLLIVSIGTWLGAAVSSWIESRDYIDEFFDTYQLLLARQLSTADWENISADRQHKTDEIFEELKNDGEEEDESLGFAVFNQAGEVIFHDDEYGKSFVFVPNADGFTTQKITRKQKEWRIVFVKSADNLFTIAVGQEQKYRLEAAFELMIVSLIPWVIGLIMLLILCFILVNYELKPLRFIANKLAKRAPNDLSPLTLKQVPAEIKPLITSMNALFARIQKMLDRERSFIADSAHELRSPITALNVQLEVAELSIDDSTALKQAFTHLKEGINRSSRLIEQLLTLSRLDSQSRETDLTQEINWQALVDSTINTYTETIEQKNISVETSIDGAPPVQQGELFLWQILMRNLLDNAIHYCPNNSTIHIIVADNCLLIQNEAPTLSAEHVSHLGERFYRPAGQSQSGSGLGLSIVKKIATLHHCIVETSVYDSQFQVRIRK